MDETKVILIVLYSLGSYSRYIRIGLESILISKIYYSRISYVAFTSKLYWRNKMKCCFDNE